MEVVPDQSWRVFVESARTEQTPFAIRKLTLFLVYCFSYVSRKGREAVLRKAFD